MNENMNEKLEKAVKKYFDLKNEVGKVKIVLVTKGISADFILAFAKKTGHLEYGENYTSELAKWEGIIPNLPDVSLNFIGSFQSGNLRKIAKMCNSIQGIESLSSFEKCKKEALKHGKTMTFYAQINIGNEPQKNGFLLQDLPSLKEFDGIMCIPPLNKNSASYFVKMREIAGQNGIKNISMGMSSDYKIAISEGATEIRVGSLIFK